MNYPKVLSEDQTVDLALSGYSLSRYGDGELRIITGGNCISQLHRPKLAKELADILTLKNSNVLVCIPNPKSKKEGWNAYKVDKFTSLYTGYPYGSSFITRPDSATWIDRPDYWAKVRQFWEDRDITLVLGTTRSLRPTELPGALSIREVWGPRRDAYDEIDRIEEEIGEPAGPVLICLGPTATVLAARLANKGVWALDLGHLGMFMRHAGGYAIKKDQLISSKYLAQNIELHERPEGFGGSGFKQAERVRKWAHETGAKVVLDYGCGQGTLAKSLKGESFRVLEYDPAIKGKDGLIKPADMIVCTDVLEHVEPELLDNVLSHIYKFAISSAYFTIATRPANKVLPDGRNAHLIIQSEDWWRGQVAKSGWKIVRDEEKTGHELRLWLRK